MISFKNNKIKSQKILEKLQQHKDKIEKHNSNVKIFNTYDRLNIPFQLKSTYNSIIPLHLYQTWHTKDLPQKMKENLEFNKYANPKITFHLYDDSECREFIKNNFEPDVLEAYNSLIPCSYKSDLWRYCVLYINGGIYLDIKYNYIWLHNQFNFPYLHSLGYNTSLTGCIIAL